MNVPEPRVSGASDDSGAGPEGGVPMTMLVSVGAAVLLGPLLLVLGYRWLKSQAWQPIPCTVSEFRPAAPTSRAFEDELSRI